MCVRARRSVYGGVYNDRLLRRRCGEGRVRPGRRRTLAQLPALAVVVPALGYVGEEGERAYVNAVLELGCWSGELGREFPAGMGG